MTSKTRKNLISNSTLINFCDYEYFYFKIPPYLTKSEKKHYTQQAQLFFHRQFLLLDENLISIVSGNNLRKKESKAKEISWEIFFQFNKIVQVKDGVFDENLNSSIAGFIGKIIDFYNDDDSTLFLISFTSDSIKKIPLEVLKYQSRLVSPFFTILESDFLLPLSNFIDNDYEEIEKIKIIEEILEVENQRGNEYLDLANYLSFWKEQIQLELNNQEEICVENDDYSVLIWKNISFLDTKYGLWGTFIRDNVEIELPLIDIETVPGHRKLDQVLQDYKNFMFYLTSI